MSKFLRYLLLVCCGCLLTACSPSQSPATQTEETSSINQKGSSAQFHLTDLTHTSHFNKNALTHIFYGTINRSGQATGFHYEGVADEAEIIASTRSKNDAHGVYRAKVRIEGTTKKAMSSFFPETWEPQEVVDAINEAYDTRELVSGNIYEGTSQGMTIQMYLTDDDKIISAFPLYQR